MQRRRSCQNSCSIHVYVVPMAVCIPVLYMLIVTVQLYFLSDQLEHRIHPGDTTHTHRHHTPHTQSQMLSSGSPTKKCQFPRITLYDAIMQEYIETSGQLPHVNYLL